ncbi:uncharacterized protein LOC129590160 [Paramacrobiotus metropolitanus]|uniref:uncharacterized protein LOC129590160 n=1 Tax=Paramacrobiotus metropolitanus TaxID=2943436 RepID=UPI0024460EBA|nr:uncharacterized protein LOC129590160 [Paramacrobiotus metropolitanus]
MFIALLIISAAVCASAQTTCNSDWTEEYVVQKDDCLSQIAKAYGVGVRAIASRNPQIRNVNFIEVDWVLCLPAGQRRRRPMKCVAGVIDSDSSENPAGVMNQKRRQPAAAKPTEPPPPTVPPTESEDYVEVTDDDGGAKTNVVTTPLHKDTRPPKDTRKNTDLKKNPLQNAASTMPTVSSSTDSSSLSANQQPVGSSLSGTIDPNIVQCQFFDNGLANCWKVCTADEFEYAVDTTSDSTITMRQCVENQAPVIHSWDVNDGILANWLRPRLIKAGGKERIIAACTFWRNRTFSCVESIMCSEVTASNTKPVCQGGKRWSGKATEGDPLRDAAIIKGVIKSPPAGGIGRSRRDAPRRDGPLDVAANTVERQRTTQQTIQSDSDPDTIQCTFYNDFHAICDDQCSYDPEVLDLENKMKIMHRVCNKSGVSNFQWTANDGIIAPGLLPNSTFRPRHRISAICTFSKTGKIFECSGVAICDPSKPAAFDQCSGGLPWRGKKTGSSDPLQSVAPIGVIESFAQNSAAASPPSSMMTEPRETGAESNPLQADPGQPDDVDSASTPAVPVSTTEILVPATASSTRSLRHRTPVIKTIAEQNAANQEAVRCANRVKSCVFGKDGDQKEIGGCFKYSVMGTSGSATASKATVDSTTPPKRTAGNMLKNFPIGHAECLILYGNEFCKVYNVSYCRKDVLEPFGRITSCGLQAVSFSAKASTMQECDSIGLFRGDQYKYTCTILKSWSADSWDHTCYSPVARSPGQMQLRIAVASTLEGEVNDLLADVRSQASAMPDVARVECDIFEKVASCVWYELAGCSDRYDARTITQVYNCFVRRFQMRKL